MFTHLFFLMCGYNVLFCLCYAEEKVEKRNNDTDSDSSSLPSLDEEPGVKEKTQDDKKKTTKKEKKKEKSSGGQKVSL